MACVAANIQSKITKQIISAEDAVKAVGRSVGYKTPINQGQAMGFIEKLTGGTLGNKLWWPNVSTPGHYVIFGEGHVVTGRVLPNGQKFIFDPQSFEVLDWETALKRLGTPDTRRLSPKN